MNIVIEKNKYGVITQEEILASIGGEKELPLDAILAGADSDKLEVLFYAEPEKAIKNIYREKNGTIREAQKSELVAAGIETIPQGKRINKDVRDYEELPPEPKNFWRLKEGELVACVEAEAELSAEKKKRKEIISHESFSQRQKIYPDFKVQNASLGVYGEEEKKQAVVLVKAYRQEYDRCATLIDNCKTIQEVREVLPEWPSYPYKGETNGN